MRECGERQHWREREKRIERAKERRREREREKEKEGEGERVLSLFIYISFFSVQGTLHFISVFEMHEMKWPCNSVGKGNMMGRKTGKASCGR